MRLPTLIACLTVSASLYAVACRSDDNNNPTDGQGSNGGSGSFVKIQDVQSEAMVPGTAVALHDVVVTAIDNFGDKKGDFWVEEKEGGKRSGIHVFKAQLTDVGMLTVGDEIDLKGAIKTEFALTGSGGDSTGRTDTELEPASGGQITITKLGTSTTITADKVDALAIGQLYDSTMAATGGGPAFTNAWEDWEGVLVELDNVSAQGAAKAFGSTTPTPADNFSLGITGVAKLEGTMTDITMSGIARGTCFAQVTGVVDYFFDYLVLPRSSTDFATGGTACPALEQAAGTDGSKCTDGTDNDGNGFSDCSDLGCEVGTNAWLGATCGAGDAMCGCSKNFASGSSVSSVNTTLATTSSAAYLHDVYITAINGTSSYWVADSLTAAANGGILVFSKAPTGATVGQKIATLQGIAGPFGTGALKQNEISNATAGALSAAGTVVALSGIALDTLTGATTGAPYTGSLVTVGPVKVGAIGAHNQVTLTGAGNKTITMDDDASFGYGGGSNATPPAANSCLNVTGVMDAQTTDQVRTINPRTVADFVTTTGCP
jgi:hypothetical protein